MQEVLRREKNIHRQVLLIDDEAINRQILGLIIKNDYDVIYAENGREALEQLKNNPNTISLILLDLQMPEMDGYEFLKLVRNNEEFRHIPVIVLTSDKAAEVETLTLGASDFMPKPYEDPKVILARCKRCIQLAEDRILISENEQDDISGLYTKPFFIQYAKRHDRYNHGVCMDMVVINVNRFKLINSLNGRSYGNNILKMIGEIITDYLKESDGIACRCESDRFYIYMQHTDDAAVVAKRIIDEFDKKIGNAKISLRIGFYEYVDRQIPFEQRIDMAETACNKLRGSYISGFNVYDSITHEKELYNEKLIMEMDQALQEKQFKVFYQPKYNIVGDQPTLVSAEALIRWFHPDHGIISPGIFISLFEENGLLQKLDQYVWNEAAEQIKDWKDRLGYSVPVSVNVSRTDVYDAKLENTLDNIITKNNLTTSDLYLEITESAYTDNTKQIIETVNHLRDKGFKIEMDDFGSGYSSLNMLAALPIDALKLDMQFIRNITRSPKDYNLLMIMLQISKFLNVPTIAEGVETKEQYEILKKAGCDIIQGYYFSKPVPAEEFEQFIVKEKQAS